jgi:hypothetical protein
MKRNLFSYCLLTLFSIFSANLEAQTIFDFKVKNASNEKDRTAMLDILRASMYQIQKQQFIYVVDHFKVGGNYAYFTGKAQRKDGKEITFPEDEAHDCCYVSALFVKKAGKWYIEDSCIFPTDACSYGIGSRHPQAPIAIFDENGRRKIYN